MILFQLSDKFLLHIVIDVTIAGESCGIGSSGAEGSGDVPQYKQEPPAVQVGGSCTPQANMTPSGKLLAFSYIAFCVFTFCQPFGNLMQKNEIFSHKAPLRFIALRRYE